MSDVPALFVDDSPLCRTWGARMCVANIGHNTEATLLWQPYVLSVSQLLDDGSLHWDDSAETQHETRIFSVGGVVYALGPETMLEIPQDTMTSTAANVPMRTIRTDDPPLGASFTLNDCCYLLKHTRPCNPGPSPMWVFDPDSGSERREMGWVRLDHGAPRIHSELDKLCVSGNRAYGVSDKGRMMWFDDATGWACSEGPVVIQNPINVSKIDVMSLGHLMLVGCDTRCCPYQWSAFDTISGELCRFPDTVSGGNEGMLFPALAVRCSRPHKMRYIDPSLVYPHSGMRWGIIPPNAVVVQKDE
ncbi:hypothetical protein KIPB_010431 [Kipferlia bialata]|uniref:DUF295 domain-containing protein n=1 Tax=Kipferlia bialata TaxID=797122 RepID=A0A391NPV8_9EUKA|nr:hypothetical protein KIPB_010431 [Kipferlia bialata]|eukprot:g10431.t1